MPVLGTITPLEFAQDEYVKLLRAWKGANPDEKERLARLIIEERRAAGKLPNFPELPGWDDLVKLGPLNARKTLEQEKARRRATAVRIASSPTPPELRALGSVINAIDDVEDIVSFISLIGRLVLRFGPKVLGKAVPYVGWLTTASDLLNLMTFMMQGAAVAAGFKLTGVTGAALQVAGIQATKALFKNELWELLRLGTRKRLGPRPLQEPLRNIITRGAVLESLQATETLWGVGISLGAVVGFIQDLAWGVQRSTFGPIPRDRDALIRGIKGEIPPEFLILKETIPFGLPCWAANGYTSNAQLYPQYVAGFLTGKKPAVTGDPAPGSPVCWKMITVTTKTLPAAYTNVVAWRVDMTRYQGSIFLSTHLGGQWHPDLRFEPGAIQAAPPKPAATPIDPVTITDFRRALDAIRSRKRARPKRGIERTIKHVLTEETQALIDRLNKEFPTSSPARGVGIDRPWDWPDEIDDAAPVLSRYAARALQALPALWLTPERWTLDEHIRAAGAGLAGLRWAIESGATDTLLRLEPRLDWIAVRTPYDDSPTTRELIRELGRDPAHSYDLPIEASTPLVRLDDYLHLTTPAITGRVRDYLARLPQGPRTLLLSNLLHTFSEELMTALNDGAEPFTYEWDPESLALLNLAHHGAWPRPDTPGPALLALLHRLAAVQQGTEQGFLPPDELHALMRSVGATPLPR